MVAKLQIAPKGNMDPQSLLIENPQRRSPDLGKPPFVHVFKAPILGGLGRLST